MMVVLVLIFIEFRHKFKGIESLILKGLIKSTFKTLVVLVILSLRNTLLVVLVSI